MYRCRREARETLTHIAYAADTGQLDKTVSEGLVSEYETALKLLSGLISSVQRKMAEHGKAKPGSTVREDGASYLFYTDEREES